MVRQRVRGEQLRLEPVGCGQQVALVCGLHAKQSACSAQVDQVDARAGHALKFGARDAHGKRIQSAVCQHGQINIAARRGLAARMAAIQPHAKHAPLWERMRERVHDPIGEVWCVHHARSVEGGTRMAFTPRPPNFTPTQARDPGDVLQRARQSAAKDMHRGLSAMAMAAVSALHYLCTNASPRTQP